MIQFLVAAIIVISSVISVPHINNYYQSQKLTKQADSLYKQDLNKEALNRYLEAQKYNNSDYVTNRIVELTNTISSDKYYELGSVNIDNKNWDEAIINLSKVSEHSKNYKTAQTLLDYAKEKLSVKEEVKGISTMKQIDSIKFVEITNSPTPASTLTPTPTLTPIPPTKEVQTQQINQDSELERQQYYIKCTKALEEIKSKYMDSCYQEHLQRSNDDYYYNWCVSIVTKTYNKGREDCANLYGN